MTLKERLKQLKAGADRQAAELGHEDAAGAAVAFGRVTGRALGNVVHDAGKLVLAFVPDGDGNGRNVPPGANPDAPGTSDSLGIYYDYNGFEMDQWGVYRDPDDD